MITPTRTLLVAHNGGLFGAERSLLSLAHGLYAHADFEPLVLVPHEGALAQACRDLGIAVSTGCYRQWVCARRSLAGVVKRSLMNVRAWWQLAPVLRRFDPQVIYTGTGTTSFGAAVAQRLGVPHVWHLREFCERDYGLHYDFGRRRSWRRIGQAEHVLANTRSIKEFFAPRLSRDDIQVIYNGFDFAAAPDKSGVEKYQAQVASAQPVQLVMLGALVEGKGQHEAIQAVAELHARGLPVQLTLAGEGDPTYRARLRDMVARHNLGAAVHFAGFVDDPRSLYQQSAATLICSRAEGFGRTAVESLSLGTPVIGTDSGGLPEILRHGQTGLLYEPGDWRALADRIRTLLTNADLYAHVCDTGCAEVRRRFAMSRYVREVGQALADTADRHAGQALTSAALAKEH